MAKNNSLATYKGRGSAGPLTYSNWKGIGYFKEKPTSVANPNTDEQQDQRGRMIQMNALWQIFGGGLQTGFKEMAVKMSQWNAFCKYNIMVALTKISTGVYELDPVNFVVAKGSIATTPITSGSANATTDNVTLNYSNTVDAFSQSLTDEAHVVLINETTSSPTPNPTLSAVRSDGTVVVPIKGGATAGDVIHAYLYFVNPTTKKVSTSVHAMYTAA